MSHASHSSGHSHHAGLGLAQVCAAGILWGTGGLGVRIVRDAEPLSVLTISAWRMLVAAAVLLLTALCLRRLGDVRALFRARPGQTVLVGAATGAYQALYFASVVWVGVTVATVVSLGVAPVLLTVFESLRDRRVPSVGRLLVLVTALVGLVLVSTAGSLAGAGSHPVAGIVAALASGSTYAMATVVGGPLARAAGPLVLTTTTTTVGAVTLVPLGLLSGLTGSPLVPTDPVAAGTLVYLGVMTMALAYALLYAGLRTTTGSAAVVATLLEPVTAAVLAAALLDERIGPTGVVGVLLILAAVVLIGLGRRTPEVPPPA